MLLQCLQNPEDGICAEMTLNLTKITLVERDMVRWAGRIQMPEAIIAEGFGDQKDAEDVGAEGCSGFRDDTRV